MQCRTFLMVQFILVAAVMLAAPASPGLQAEPPATGTVEESGYCSNPASDPAGAVWERTYEWSNLTILEVKLSLTWTDDEGSRSRPDEFKVSASDGGKGSASDSGSGGSLSLSAPSAQGPYDHTWTVRVECTAAGSTPVGPVGLISNTDPGNSWSFKLEYTYTPKSGGGPPGMPANVREVLSSPIFWAHIVLMISSTYGFLVVGLLAGFYLLIRSRWAQSPSRLQRILASPRPYRSLAPHVWFAFFLASVPIGMWVAGKFYGWENAWSGIPAFWNPDAFTLKNADNSALLALTLWAIPSWLNRGDILTRKPHFRWLRWSGWLKRVAARSPGPRLTDREMALIHFFLGILIFAMFMVQSHGS
jgi:hypothetical protein